MKLKYFAFVRERIGTAEEDLQLPASVVTVRDLLEWLRTQGEGYEEALRHQDAIRVAVDHEHAGHEERIAGAREIALFPPMTGG